MGTVSIVITIVLLLILAAAAVALFLFGKEFFEKIINWIKNWINTLLTRNVPLGGKCTFPWECQGWGILGEHNLCCDGVCTKAGCLFLDKPLCPGTQNCGQPLGGKCKLATDCKGWGEAAENIVCCDDKCTKPSCTKLGVGYCEKDCPQPIGGPCKLATDCKGWGEAADNIVCCDDKCTKPSCTKLGVGYCEKDCPQPIGGPCNVATDCKGWGESADNIVCCDKKCTKPDCTKQGVGYCPGDCGYLGDKCSAPNGTPWPASGCDVSAGLCCHGKCSRGAVCPSDCGGGFHKCKDNDQCCSGECKLLDDIPEGVKCPGGHVDHGSYACCKNIFPPHDENHHDCHDFSCCPTAACIV